MNSKQKKQILQKLKEDEHYYGTFGKQYLSNSDISTLLNNPLQLSAPSKPNPNFLVGGYFHTAILEPEKLASFKIVEVSIYIYIYEEVISCFIWMSKQNP